jgi:hypothetical protein
MSDKNNPANVAGLPKGFKPMTSAVLRLEVPEREGYHRHWFRGTPERLARAQQAGYRFVDSSDETVSVNNFDLAGDSDAGGSTDLGSRISVISGDDVDGAGQPGRLYLMECPMEYYEAAQRILAERNEAIAATIRGGSAGAGQQGETRADFDKRYTRDLSVNLFTPKNRS